MVYTKALSKALTVHMILKLGTPGSTKTETTLNHGPAKETVEPEASKKVEACRGFISHLEAQGT